MMPLTVEDLLPLEEYVPRRREFFDSHRRYIDRCRRVRLGARLTLIFENRQTLWFRVQEMVRIARLSQRSDLEQELSLYNRLLPGSDLLQAALIVEFTSEAQRVSEEALWNDLRGHHLHLHLGSDSVAAHFATDHRAGTSHWVQFPIGPWLKDSLMDDARPAIFTFDNGYFQLESAPLTGDLRHSLLADLAAATEEAGVVG